MLTKIILEFCFIVYADVGLLGFILIQTKQFAYFGQENLMTGLT